EHVSSDDELVRRSEWWCEEDRAFFYAKTTGSCTTSSSTSSSASSANVVNVGAPGGGGGNLLTATAASSSSSSSNRPLSNAGLQKRPHHRGLLPGSAMIDLDALPSSAKRRSSSSHNHVHSARPSFMSYTSGGPAPSPNFPFPRLSSRSSCSLGVAKKHSSTLLVGRDTINPMVEDGGQDLLHQADDDHPLSTSSSTLHILPTFASANTALATPVRTLVASPLVVSAGSAQSATPDEQA
ncbi:unnamed protein product, partial [Amoebophrya sp. A25]